MTPAQESAIKCAHADLQGALQAFEQNDIHVHDWEAHQNSIDELEEAFPLLCPSSKKETLNER